MNFLGKIKECGTATLAIVIAVILFVTFGLIPLQWDILCKFLIGAVLFILGQSLFLVGVESSIVKMGTVVGGGLVKFKKLWLILLFGFIFGFVTTIAEPDVGILVEQISGTQNLFTTFLLLFIFGIGVGSLVVFGIVKIFKKIPFSVIMAIGYALVFTLVIFTPKEYVGMAFDGGGVTTGPITSPFLLAMTISLAGSVGAKKDHSFGMIAIASLGAIIFMLVFGIIQGNPQNIIKPIEISSFGTIMLQTMLSAFFVLTPLVIIFLIFQYKFAKLPKFEIQKILFGVSVCFVGLVLLLTGIAFGFVQMGNFAGKAFANNVILGTGGTIIACLFIGILGFLIVFTEPSVIVLGQQIEEATSKVIKKRAIIIAMAVGIFFASILAVLMIKLNISLWIILLPMLFLAVILSFMLPQVFSGICFDGGGVASGTMAAGFILPFANGFSQGLNSLSNGFGVIAIIATVPILTLEILSFIFVLKQRKNVKLINQINKMFFYKYKRAKQSAKILMKGELKKEKQFKKEQKRRML
ncbi:MAG: DUF1538 family protein [Clostridia bacterium]